MRLRELPAEFTRVVPTRRLAHALRLRHDADCAARGLTVWRTLDVVTWDELIERMFASDRQAGRAGGRWLPAGAAQIVWERIVHDDGDLPPLVLPSGAARAAWRSWRRMHDYLIPHAELRGAESPEADAFLRWCDRYARWLAAHDACDVSLAQQSVSPLGAGPGLELVGFDRYTPVQSTLLERWSASGLEVRRSEARPGRARAVRTACRDRAAEIDAAARWAAGRLDSGAASRIAIVVPGLAHRRDEVRRLVERVIEPATGLTGGPAPQAHRFELAAARPLAEQPIVAAALDLLDAFTGTPDAAALSGLLRNPFVAGAALETPARARLDAGLRRQGNATGIDPSGVAQLAIEGGAPVFGRSVLAAIGIMAQWPRTAAPSASVTGVLAFLDALGWGGTPLDSTEHQVVQRWQQLVSEFAALDEATGPLSRSGVAGLLRELAGRVLFEPQEIRAPLLVIDPETCAGMHFDAAWICGLDATRWPPPAAPDPFLPVAAQRRHGVPRASTELADREARETLDRLLRSAAEAVLSVPLLEDDAPLLPSPLLTGIEAGDAGAGWPEPRVAAALFAQQPLLEVLSDDALPPLRPEEAGRGGARLLELQAACPFRAQAEVRLGAVALDEATIGVGVAERGDLVHAVLAAVWAELGDHAALQALDSEATRAFVERAVAAALAVARETADEVLRHLLDLEAGWLVARVLEILRFDREREPFSVVAVETPRTLQLGALRLEVRPDRVDRLADGSLAIIDYKTGADADARSWLDERPRLPQLPAYAQAFGAEPVGALAFARVRSGETGYAGLARSPMNFAGLDVVGEKGGPAGYASWEQLQGEWRRRLESLAHEYEAGEARLAPDPGRACRYCHLGSLCRIASTRLSAAMDGQDD